MFSKKMYGKRIKSKCVDLRSSASRLCVGGGGEELEDTFVDTDCVDVAPLEC